ncbi:MAG: hypothetical protein CMO81_01930 [Waddliaceae bacterium]|nr:hypothetical protein [Waddliaceae bacterium]
MSESVKKAQNPLILRCHRLMEAFAKSDDERDFYLDKQEGFILFADLNKPQDDLNALYKEIEENPERYCLVPKLTFYETKKIMEGFVHEKVYDIDTKEKLLDIIQSKDARENFLEFIHDHHAELEKWQQYYQERSRIRIIEWLRSYEFYFVFEEDLDLARSVVEKLKKNLFEAKVPKDLMTARKNLTTKAKSYYSNEALNPRPKRGRPPKQAPKVEVETQVSRDIYITLPDAVETFLFSPDITSASSVSFSARFDSEEEIVANMRNQVRSEAYADLESLNKKLSTLRQLTRQWNAEQPDSSDRIPELAPKEDIDNIETILDLSTDRPSPAHDEIPERPSFEEEEEEETVAEEETPAEEKKTPRRRGPAKKRLTPLRPRRARTTKKKEDS